MILSRSIQNTNKWSKEDSLDVVLGNIKQVLENSNCDIDDDMADDAQELIEGNMISSDPDSVETINATPTKICPAVQKYVKRKSWMPNNMQNVDNSVLNNEGDDGPLFIIDKNPMNSMAKNSFLNLKFHERRKANRQDLATSRSPDSVGEIFKNNSKWFDSKAAGKLASAPTEITVEVPKYSRHVKYYASVFRQPDDFTGNDRPSDKVDDIMKNCIVTSEFLQKTSNLPCSKSRRAHKKQLKLEKSKKTSKEWFELPIPEKREQDLTDLKLLKMRKVLNPKVFYKSSDHKNKAPKFYQKATIIESKADFYSSRIPKKQRKSTIAEELLADDAFRSYNKRKYQEIVESKRRGTGAYDQYRLNKLQAGHSKKSKKKSH